MRWGGVVALCALGLLVARTLRINISPSIPIGVYIVERPPHPVQRGAVVLVCLPDPIALLGRERGYLMRGTCSGGVAPVGKPVFAVAGDTVVVRGDAVRCCGASVRAAPLDHDAAGRPLSHITDGTYIVPPGMMWLLSTWSPRSWDSRYYGAVPVSDVQGVAHQIVVMP